ncbi:hypothetical protein EAO71_28840 [Streptomyces sp. ms191]|uniref:hypothetical protein n=1 Tax=unclassified Streptomyces TaxID=2593676 RepID=UPI0011CD8B6B|nr:hypothetical protein [Streptomyces sp. ms191]TXS20556.1 hypothetical protein EAO71_28840 [Streptomyces sp. ms191]
MAGTPEEEPLRRGLRDLAGAGPLDAGPAPVATVVARGRRIRRLRRSLAVGTATLLVAGGVTLGARWSGPEADTPPAGPTTATPPPVQPFVGKYPPQPPSGPGDPLDGGPTRPRENVRYRYDLSTVCALRYAVFGGRVWERADGGGTSAGDGATDRVRGYMSWTDGRFDRAERDTAVFETDDRPPLTFRPLTGGPPACLDREPRRRHGDAPAATLGPDRPSPGRRYVYDMPKECALRYAVFGGRLWRAEGDEASHTAIDWVDDLPLAAHMTLTSPSTAVLEWPSLPGQAPRTTTYRPAAGPGTDCAR